MRPINTLRAFGLPALLIFLLSSGGFADSSTTNKTVTNLENAIQSEANAANRYQLFSHKAEQEGFPQVAKLFRAAAEAESIHRENHQMALFALGGPSVSVQLEPVKVDRTRRNLELPIQGEAQERAVYYPRVIQQAKKDHAEQAVRSFEFARTTEAEHEQLFRRALAELGHNPHEDYYVSKNSGDTVALPVGHTLSKSQTKEYILVG